MKFKWIAGVLIVGGVILFSQTPVSQTPVMKQGIRVEMASAEHAVETKAADNADAIVVAITVDGKVFVGITPVEPGALSNLPAETVYVKADRRVPFQTLLATLDALRGKSVVLLTAPPENLPKQSYMPPYGTRLAVAR